MPCEMCLDRGKTWSGSDPLCYFDGDRNWNCATINAVRDILTPNVWWTDPDELPVGVTALFLGDTTCGLIKIYDLGEEWIGRCLYVQWYKRQGHTDCLWVLSEDESRKPTEKELLAVIEYYKDKTNLLEE